MYMSVGHGICRVCCLEYSKKDLNKTISNKMLNEFLTHLQKRMRVEDYEKI